MNMTRISEYVRTRAQHFLQSRQVLSVDAKLRYGPSGVIGVVFRVGPMRAIYVRSQKVVLFYDGQMRLVCKDRCPETHPRIYKPGIELPRISL